MELKCPTCCSSDVQSGPRKSPGARMCGSCGAAFRLEDALLTVAEAITGSTQRDPRPSPLFGLDRERAEDELGYPDGAIKPTSPFSDADELNSLFESALGAELITCDFESAYISIYPMSLALPDPLPAVEIGGGTVLLGSALNLTQFESEDPIAYTLRILSETVSKANELSARFGLAERRLDRIAEWMNRVDRFDNVYFVEFVVGELQASGRQIRERNE